MNDFDLLQSANAVRAKISDEARGRLEYYRELYRKAAEDGDELAQATAYGQIKGYTDALAGFKVITDSERPLLNLYYIDGCKEDNDNV